MPDGSDYFRGYARDVGVNPPIGGATNVQDALAAGGGGSFPDFTGAGTPEGVITAAVGKSYVDTTNGALYWKASGAGNTGWSAGVGISDASVAGVFTDGSHFVYVLGDPATGASGLSLGDLFTFLGIGNGLMFGPGTPGMDGTQAFTLKLGSSGQHSWHWAADGSTVFPGAAGFNGSTPPPKAATPVLLADVITILQDLGFCS